MGIQRPEHRLNILVDGRGPVGRLRRDRKIGHALPHVVAGHAHIAAGKLRQRIPSFYPLPYPHQHLRHDAINRRGIVDLPSGVVIDPPRDRYMVAKWHAAHRHRRDFGSSRRCRQRDDFIRRGSGGRLALRMPRVVPTTAGKVVRGQPPPGKPTGGEKGHASEAAANPRQKRARLRCVGCDRGGHDS